jgi:hypothetical protein
VQRESSTVSGLRAAEHLRCWHRPGAAWSR